MSDELKSAWELAMEKLGAAEPIQELSPQQKEEIGEIRRVYRARIAEREITLQGEIRKAAQAGEFEKVESLRNQLAEEKRTLESQCEEAVAKIKK